MSISIYILCRKGVKVFTKMRHLRFDTKGNRKLIGRYHNAKSSPQNFRISIVTSIEKIQKNKIRKMIHKYIITFYDE